MAYMLFDEKTRELELGKLLKIFNHYQKYLATLNCLGFSSNYKVIEQVHLHEFL